MDDQDKVTELKLDDQQTEADDIVAGRLTIRLGEPLRRMRRRQAAGHEDAATRLQGRRPPDRIQGLSVHQRAGAIGGHRHHPGPEPVDQRDRVPGRTPDRARRAAGRSSRAAIDQPGLRIPGATFRVAPGCRGGAAAGPRRTRTLFQIGADHARSDATIELERVRGRPSEVELDIGPGLQVVSVGPDDLVEGWSLIGKPSARPGTGGTGAEDPAESFGSRSDEGDSCGWRATSRSPATAR